MGRLINVLTNEERAVKVRISVLEEKELELKLRIDPIKLRIEKLDIVLRNLRREEVTLRQMLKSSKLKRFKKDQVYPETFDWSQGALINEPGCKTGRDNSS